MEPNSGSSPRPVILAILDGWGLGENNESNPIHMVRPETFARLEKEYPLGSLQASGISVGLPWGETGNSEVGHLTLGAGKVVYQYYPRITMAIEDGTFFTNPALVAACAHAKKNSSALNLVGLLTKANTHASLEHLQALLKLAEQTGVSNVNLHLFADGKDSPPRSLAELLTKIPRDKLATLTGRYYAMDRNQNWSLTEKAYQVLTSDSAPLTPDLQAVQNNTYARGYTEEYLPPLRLRDGAIADKDAVIFFNFREDSIRQLAEAFLLPGFDKFPVRNFSDLHIALFTRYESSLAAPVAFPAEGVELPLSAVLATAGKIQLRLAETYKYAHVTYFFNGHREAPYKNEYRVLVPSDSGGRPEEHPELQAAAVTDRLVEAITNRGFDFILVNYSNPDTLAHTGNYEACLAAVRIMDRELARVVQAVEQTGAVLIVTSDHGNLEEVLDPRTGQAETQHDSNPVPIYLVAPEFKGRKFLNWQNLRSQTTGILCDVAPTILEIMGLPQPPEMTGESLLRSLL